MVYLQKGTNMDIFTELGIESNEPKIVEVHNEWLPWWAYSNAELDEIMKNHRYDNIGYIDVVHIEKMHYVDMI